MKIPEGWPTGRMWSAFEDATGVEMNMKAFEKGVKAMLAAAPTPIPAHYEEQPDGTILPVDPADMGLTPPAQEDEPVGVVVRFSDGPWGEIHSEHRADIKQGTKLYTRPKSYNSAEKIAQMLEAIKEVDVLIRNNLPVDKTTPAWGMIKKILYK